MMEKQIKMIALDLDGTLLNEQKAVTEHTREVLTAAIAQGVTVLVATGRPLVGVPAVLRQFPGIRYVVTANGARVVDQQKDKILYERLIKPEAAEKVLDIFAEYDTLREVFHNGKGYMNRVDKPDRFFENDLMKEYILTTRKPVRDLKETTWALPGGFDKVRAVFSCPQEREEAMQRMKSEKGLAVTSAIHNDIEVNLAGVNKGTALLALGERLGIWRDEIMACGDGMNDVEMISQAGLGVAMENGVEEVRRVADHITAANDDEGVAKAIEMFILK